jgi:hypothetical protein
MTDYREVTTTEHEQGRGQRVATFKATQIIWLLLGLLEAAIALRIVFKLIAVNAANPFAKLLYGVTNLFLAPFKSLVGNPTSSNNVLEITSIIAMLVYLLIAWGIERIVYVLFYRDRGPVSVRQTTVAEHTPLQAPVGVSQTTTTQTPVGTSQTTVTQRTKT